MKSCRTALIAHLQTATVASQAETIDKYAGELSDRDRTPSRRINLPAILVLFIEGYPQRDVKEYEFSLLFITENSTAAREESESDALGMVEEYAAWMVENETFLHDGLYWHFVDVENARATTILSDHKYTIIELSTTVRKIS